MGFKLSKGKTYVMPESFKFLGHWFNTLLGTTGIPPLKLNAFLGLRSPQSKAEAVSRLGTIAYFSQYVPLLRLISLPIQHMITAEEGFKWNRIHQLAFDTIKFICSLQFTNATIDPSRPLFVSVDSSQICIALLAYQIDNEGNMVLIYCDSRVLKQADRNKPSSFRELLALVFGVIQMEAQIRGHQSDVVILTDCVSLSLIYKQKFHNARLMEISIFLASFGNLSVQYVTGNSLFFADLISRAFNKIHLENEDSEVSKEFCQILPPMDKKHTGARLSPQMLTDLMLTRQSKEYNDCFSRRSFYTQNLTRYH
jgi:hypothetical protein